MPGDDQATATDKIKGDLIRFGHVDFDTRQSAESQTDIQIRGSQHFIYTRTGSKK